MSIWGFFRTEFALGLFDSESEQISSTSQDTLNRGKPERKRTMSKVYDRKPFGNELTAVCAGDGITTKKSSLKSMTDGHEPLPTDEIATKPSLRMRCDKIEPKSLEDTLVEITPKPSYTNLNPSKSLQSTKTSNSSLMRNIGKREVRRGLRGGLRVMRGSCGI